MPTEKKELDIYTKIAQVQNEIGKLVKDKENPYYKSRYFDINQLLEQLQPLLQKNGLVVTQPLTNLFSKPAIKTVITDGTTTLKDIIPLPDIQDPQKMGSAITYYRRYALQSWFALQAEDNDGETKEDIPLVDLNEEF